MDTSGLWHEKCVNLDGVISKENLSNIFLEIIRLWPPFFGGLRVAKQDMNLGSFCVPQGKFHLFLKSQDSLFKNSD